MINTFSDRAVEQISYEIRTLRSNARNLEQQLSSLRRGVQRPGGGKPVLYGQPLVDQPSGTVNGEYALYDYAGAATGKNQTGVSNNTTQTLKQNILHILWPVDGGYTAFPAELEACGASNPVV